MVSYQRARRATKKRAENIALETIIEGALEFDFTPESLYRRFREKSKRKLKTDKKARKDVGKSIVGIIKDFLNF
ncbi:MAG: hypothetical protein IIC67_10125 [Thaumarchaeota archaeon]|nr:hypothetical protein [Nitrososphaerota archaeon]